jgi:hypothetical protein
MHTPTPSDAHSQTHHHHQQQQPDADLFQWFGMFTSEETQLKNKQQQQKTVLICTLTFLSDGYSYEENHPISKMQLFTISRNPYCSNQIV